MNDYMTIDAKGYTFGILAERDDDGIYRPNIAILNPKTGEPVARWYEDYTEQDAYATLAECMSGAMKYIYAV